MINPRLAIIYLFFIKNGLTYWCSLIGAAIIIIGFYAVIWAQAQEEHTTSENNISPSSSVPLLLNKSMDI